VKALSAASVRGKKKGTRNLRRKSPLCSFLSGGGREDRSRGKGRNRKPPYERRQTHYPSDNAKRKRGLLFDGGEKKKGKTLSSRPKGDDDLLFQRSKKKDMRSCDSAEGKEKEKEGKEKREMLMHYRKAEETRLRLSSETQKGGRAAHLLLAVEEGEIAHSSRLPNSRKKR